MGKNDTLDKIQQNCGKIVEFTNTNDIVDVVSQILATVILFVAKWIIQGMQYSRISICAILYAKTSVVRLHTRK